MRLIVFVSLFVVLGCSVDHSGLGPSNGDDAAIDASVPDASGEDAGSLFDGGLVDAGSPFDGGPLFDGGPDVGFDAGEDAASFDGGLDAGCMTSSCDGDDFLRCEGGVETRITCALACVDGGRIGCQDLDVTNLDDPLWDAPPAASLNVSDERWDTTSCSALPGYWQVQTQADDSDICVVVFDDLAINGVFAVVGTRSLMIIALGTMTINGTIEADGTASVPGPGGGHGTNNSGDAEGTNPGDGGGHLENWSDGGGGGGGAAGTGGRGGEGGDDPRLSRAERGGKYAGGFMLMPLRAGSGGGAGGTGESYGRGGGGGGGLQLVAREGIIVNGTIDVSGGGGGGGGDGTGSDHNIGAGGGGGSGGGVMLETAGTIEFMGAARVLAAGGGGGGGAGCRTWGDGEDGSEERSGSVDGGDHGPACANGTNYGADGRAGGIAGGGNDGTNARVDGANGGGGGGGAGLVVYRAENVNGRAEGSGIRRTTDPVYEVND